MEVDYAFLCANAEYERSDRVESINATGICANCHLSIPHFPCKISFCLVVCWHPGDTEELDDTTDNFLYVGFTAPDKKKISLDYRAKPLCENKPNTPSKSKQKGLLIMPINNLPLEVPGIYTINLCYGEKTKWTSFITIRQGSEEIHGDRQK